MFDRLRYKLQTFMYGRNGADSLNRIIAIAAIVLTVLNIFIKSQVLSWISMFLIILYFIRFFSKNIPQRMRENDFITGLPGYLKLKWEMRKTHKVYRCSGCLRVIRVPKNHGNVEVTCPQCGKIKKIYTGPKQ